MDTETVPKFVNETNVRVPRCAFDALNAVAARRDTSRDATIRSLLTEHVEAQGQLNEDDRLTHVSTLLRYPLHRKKWFRLADHDVEVVPLRLRVDPRVVEQARSLAFRLPGQPPRRGHEDYQARLLTDAVMTAIARAKFFDDPFLAGLLPLIRQRAALELWHLAVELTLTRAEREASARAGVGSRERRTAELLDDDDEAWHDDHRLTVLRRFAGPALGEGDLEANEKTLYRGRRPTSLNSGPDLVELGLDLREATDSYGHELIGDVGTDWRPVGREGRGATAVWRASHRAAIEEVPAWLAKAAGGPLQIEKGDNGWALTVPDGWRSLASYTRLEALPATWAEHVAAGRVLEFEHSRWRVLWPVTAAEQPVGRLDVALSACPDEVAGAQRVELLLLATGGSVPVPPITAVHLGLLTQAAAKTVIADAVELTQLRMRETIKAAAHRLPADVVAELEAATSYPGFVKACARRGVDFKYRHDTGWPWRVPSLAVAVGDSAISDAALAWLGKERLQSWRTRLRDAEHSAWRRAFERFKAARRPVV